MTSPAPVCTRTGTPAGTVISSRVWQWKATPEHAEVIRRTPSTTSCRGADDDVNSPYGVDRMTTASPSPPCRVTGPAPMSTATSRTSGTEVVVVSCRICVETASPPTTVVAAIAPITRPERRERRRGATDPGTGRVPVLVMAARVRRRGCAAYQVNPVPAQG